MKPVFEINGANFSDLNGFYDEFDRVVKPESWGHNLDAFNDLLHGGFGTPETGFIVKWKNSELSKQRLSYKYGSQNKTAFEHLIDIFSDRNAGTNGNINLLLE